MVLERKRDGRRTERAMIRVMCGMRLLDRRNQRGVDGHVGHKEVFR